MVKKEINVLLVEDNPGDVRLVSEMLRVCNLPFFTLTHAGQISEALKELKAGEFDVVLLDLNLPDSRGLDGLERIVHQTPTTPVILLTGLDSEDVGLQALQKHAADYLVKGRIDTSLLTRGIRYAIERKRTEQKLQASVKEKETLLRELSHRTKNNMNVISSLITLQSSSVKDSRTLEMLKDLQGRILTMSLVHEKLYQSRDLANVDMNEYVSSLSDGIMASYRIEAENVTLDLDIENLTFLIDDAIPCGLIVNELMTNSLKHAFPDKKKGVIRISLHQVDEHEFTIQYTDNGVGLPKEFDLKSAKSLGIKLIHILATKQLKGKVEISHGKGADFLMRLKKTKEHSMTHE